MKGRTKGILGAGIVAAVLLIAGVFFLLERRRLARMTAEAPAEVTGVSVERRRRRMRNETRTFVSYRFNVGGQWIQDSSDKGGDQRATYRPGAPLKVCYNPSKPEESEIFTPDHQCGK